MANNTLNLSIPAELKEKARTQAQVRHFSSTSDYLQHLIRTDVEQAEHTQKLEAFLLAGIASGKGKKMTLDDLDGWMKKVINDAR